MLNHGDNRRPERASYYLHIVLLGPITQQDAAIAIMNPEQQQDQPDPADGYRIYLLAVWRIKGSRPDDDGWRFRLEDPRSGEKRGCASVEALAEMVRESILDGGGLAG